MRQDNPHIVNKNAVSTKGVLYRIICSVEDSFFILNFVGLIFRTSAMVFDKVTEKRQCRAYSSFLNKHFFMLRHHT